MFPRLCNTMRSKVAAVSFIHLSRQTVPYAALQISVTIPQLCERCSDSMQEAPMSLVLSDAWFSALHLKIVWFSSCAGMLSLWY